MVTTSDITDDLTNGSWYLIYTKARQEAMAAQGLREQGYAVYLPKLRQRRWMRGRLADMTGVLPPLTLHRAWPCRAVHHAGGLYAGRAKAGALRRALPPGRSPVRGGTHMWFRPAVACPKPASVDLSMTRSIRGTDHSKCR